MPDLLGQAMAFLTAKMAIHASQPATYSRGSSSVEVRATLGRQLLQLNDGLGGVRMEWTDLDFLIPAEDLVIAGSPIVPQRRDTITTTIRGELQRYEVHPYSQSEPCFRWSDPGQTMARIHTKRVAT